MFDAVRLDGGTTLHQAHAMSFYPGDDRAWQQASSQPPPEHWRDVSDAELNEFGHDLVFLDARGFRFYLPALMCWSIRQHCRARAWSGDQTLLFQLGPGPRHETQLQERLAAITVGERRVIAAFLAYLVICHRDTTARESLESGWRPLLFIE